ncbi:DUF342 domain-containing protein [Vibrio albus]|uniref:DUF342 domain-containing protein n=1 Tax=Vibrio albus TaxID=2200953 RepID=A0A2U3B768_9VIBR|nr:FapA family protein [Vibrio albus]PWI32631.1 DUF342 domain-containing protein [Vibrio albus]
MWKELVHLSDDGASVIAKLPAGEEASQHLSNDGLDRELEVLGVGRYLMDNEAVTRFINAAKEGSGSAYEGIEIAAQKNAQVEISLSDHDMIANMKVTGAYGGRGVNGPEILRALAEAKVIKGINKLALKKVLSVSRELGPGESFTQPVAQGTLPEQGEDTKFIPQVPDVNQRVLSPQESNSKTGKVDMRNLGETITVEENDPLMRRIPATKGRPGFTVLGEVIPPKPGHDSQLKPGKGSAIDKADPNLLVATQPGMPMIKNNSVDVDPALCLSKVDATTGHVKFKGSVVISGNVEPSMVVRATGSITIGGFIESADVQAQEDIIVGQGIIGHAVDDDQERVCSVKSNGSIRTKYAQYAQLQAAKDIEMEIHCLSNDVKCGGDLTVCDASDRKGTLSGGKAVVGGKIICVNLGVEGDTATFVQAFSRYGRYKERIEALRDSYRVAQDETMKVVRAEINLKKKPKAERTQEDIDDVDKLKLEKNQAMEQAKSKLERAESEFEYLLKENAVIARSKVYTRVTVQFGESTVITKREHAACTFSFDQYQIKCRSMVEGVGDDEDA